MFYFFFCVKAFTYFIYLFIYPILFIHFFFFSIYESIYLFQTYSQTHSTDVELAQTNYPWKNVYKILGLLFSNALHLQYTSSFAYT